MQYGQNISIPYSQPQNEHNNMFANDHKDNLLKTKMERDRDEGLFCFIFIEFILFLFLKEICIGNKSAVFLNKTKFKQILEWTTKNQSMQGI